MRGALSIAEDLLGHYLVGNSAVGLGLDYFCDDLSAFGLPDKIVT